MGIEFSQDPNYGEEREERVEYLNAREKPKIQFAPDHERDTFGVNGGPKITVVGVGGGGSNAVDSMGDGSLEGVEFIVINTDLQALQRAKTMRRIHIGRSVTKGLGTGANPVLGEQAANEDRDVIRQNLEGADLVFITAGLGGGTGTGASSVIADVVKEIGALSVAITTKPFDFEGSVRRNHAEKGQQILRKKVDTLITVPNQRLISVVNESTTLIEAFRVADGVLKQCVQSIADLITRPGLINLDFADIKAIMDAAGGAVMGVGYGHGSERADEAFKQASCSPLMEEQVIEGAKGILINITSGPDIRLLEIDKAITRHVRDKADPDANVIFGVVIDPDMEEEMKVTILATGSAQTEKTETPRIKMEENRAGVHPPKSPLKVSLPYTKKGLGATIDDDHPEQEEMVLVDSSKNSSAVLDTRPKPEIGKRLPPMTKTLFSIRKDH
ncbi:MAG TPA: cell division protein FtsZ [bacterium]|nr:cell division protein FtsZ [Candidatus Omnitrophota bacterium]HOL92877.1 cell division protein FtsZ [bacterium]HPO99940.1 cell division protein FtsZ [bacterium]HXK92809.1 cell division protein FtsZ [bacterium]